MAVFSAGPSAAKGPKLLCVEFLSVLLTYVMEACRKMWHTSSVTGHRVFLFVSLSSAALIGTGLGLWMILGWLGWVSLAHFPEILRMHAQFQVYGFVVLFTMGVAMMVLPRFLGTALRPPGLIPVCLGLMVSGTLVNLLGPTALGAALQTGAVVAFMAIIRATRKSAPARLGAPDPLQKAHALFLASGGVWLMAGPGLALLDSTRALESVLWGFAGLYIAGIGLRVHPQILALPSPRSGLLVSACLLWNLALLTRWLVEGPAWSILLTIGAACFLAALNPFRASTAPMESGSWVRVFVRTAYLWLVVAALLTVATELEPGLVPGPARHSLASGFILTMMMGMGFRMIPNFEELRLTWSDGPWVTYFILTLGGVLRVGGQAVGNFQALGLGGTLQLVSIFLFAGLILSTLLFGRSLESAWKRNQPV